VQNKNKKTLNQQINKFSRNSVKVLADLLIINIIIKVLVLGALFFIPKNPIFAEDYQLNAQQLIALTNQERIANNLPALTTNKKLQLAATNKAQDMIKNDYFAHTNPEGKPFYHWIQEVEYSYKSAGENLAISFIRNQDVIAAWMASKTHRENILDPDFNEIGIAVLQGKIGKQETNVIVQEFGEPLGSSLVKGENINTNQIITQTLHKSNNLYLYISTFSKTLNFSLVVLSFLLLLVVFEQTILNIYLKINLKQKSSLIK